MTWFILRNIFFLAILQIYLCVSSDIVKKNWSQNTYMLYIYFKCIYIFLCWMIKKIISIFFKLPLIHDCIKMAALKYISLSHSPIMLYSSIPSITFPFHDKNDFESNHKIHIKTWNIVGLRKIVTFPILLLDCNIIIFFLCVSLLGGHIKLMSRKTKIWWV